MGGGGGSLPDIEDDNLGGIHEDGGHVSRVLLVPTQPQEGDLRLGALVDDGAVLLVPASHHIASDQPFYKMATPAALTMPPLLSEEISLCSLRDWALGGNP